MNKQAEATNGIFMNNDSIQLNPSVGTDDNGEAEEIKANKPKNEEDNIGTQNKEENKNQESDKKEEIKSEEQEPEKKKRRKIFFIIPIVFLLSGAILASSLAIPYLIKKNGKQPEKNVEKDQTDPIDQPGIKTPDKSAEIQPIVTFFSTRHLINNDRIEEINDMVTSEFEEFKKGNLDIYSLANSLHRIIYNQPERVLFNPSSIKNQYTYNFDPSNFLIRQFNKANFDIMSGVSKFIGFPGFSVEGNGETFVVPQRLDWIYTNKTAELAIDETIFLSGNFNGAKHDYNKVHSILSEIFKENESLPNGTITLTNFFNFINQINEKIIFDSKTISSISALGNLNNINVQFNSRSLDELTGQAKFSWSYRRVEKPDSPLPIFRTSEIREMSSLRTKFIGIYDKLTDLLVNNIKLHNEYASDSSKNNNLQKFNRIHSIIHSHIKDGSSPIVERVDGINWWSGLIGSIIQARSHSPDSEGTFDEFENQWKPKLINKRIYLDTNLQETKKFKDPYNSIMDYGTNKIDSFKINKISFIDDTKERYVKDFQSRSDLPTFHYLNNPQPISSKVNAIIFALDDDNIQQSTRSEFSIKTSDGVTTLFEKDDVFIRQYSAYGLNTIGNFSAHYQTNLSEQYKQGFHMDSIDISKYTMTFEFWDGYNFESSISSFSSFTNKLSSSVKFARVAIPLSDFRRVSFANGSRQATEEKKGAGYNILYFRYMFASAGRPKSHHTIVFDTITGKISIYAAFKNYRVGDGTTVSATEDGMYLIIKNFGIQLSELI